VADSGFIPSGTRDPWIALDSAPSHLQMLAAARLLQNRDIRKALRTARTPAEVAAVIGYSTEPAPAGKT